MKKEVCEATAVAVASFGLPILGWFLPLFLPALLGFAGLCLSFMWAGLAFQIIEEFGGRGAWILLTAPLALFWWLPAFVAVGAWLVG